MRHLSPVTYLLFLAAVSALQAQDVDWRFGIEYIEIEPPWASEQQHDTLLSRLALMTSSQRSRGGINVNGLGGGWRAMQPTESSPISFSNTDKWVKRLGRGGFELVWNLELFPEWSRAGNIDCIDGPGLDDCAPDYDHFDDWYRYVHEVVERYDGDGVDDMPGLVYPVRFYVMPQEIYFAGQAHGDAGEEAGEGYWDDSNRNLVRMHREAWRAVHDADPTGRTKLVGSGGWLLDLYSDFPDYPAVDGPTVQQRLNGDNLRGTAYSVGYKRLGELLDTLGSDAGGRSCDYIEWHPHSGWRSSDQSLRFLRAHAPNKPIFVDDMWSGLLTDILPYDGYWQFLRITSVEKDFATAPVASFRALRDSLNAGDPATLAWYNTKTARDAVKCFATIFGEGVERGSFSLSNDCNPNNPIFILSQAWRYTGLVGDLTTNYAPKPVLYAMRTLIHRLHDFTAVTRLDLTGSPWTRCYRFERERGTPCYVLWSEYAVPSDPEVPNGEVVTLPVGSDTIFTAHIPLHTGEIDPKIDTTTSMTGAVSLALGHTPLIIEEGMRTSSIPRYDPAAKTLDAWINGDRLVIHLRPALPTVQSIALYDLLGRRVRSLYVGMVHEGNKVIIVPTTGLARGLYFVRMVGSGARVVVR